MIARITLCKTEVVLAETLDAIRGMVHRTNQRFSYCPVFRVKRNSDTGTDLNINRTDAQRGRNLPDQVANDAFGNVEKFIPSLQTIEFGGDCRTEDIGVSLTSHARKNPLIIGVWRHCTSMMQRCNKSEIIFPFALNAIHRLVGRTDEFFGGYTVVGVQ